MNAHFAISDIAPAAEAAREAAAVSYVPPCIIVRPDAFFLFNERADIGVPKLTVIVRHDPSADAGEFRNPLVTRIEIAKNPDFIAGDSYNAQVAAEIYASNNRAPTPAQKRMLMAAISGVAKMAAICGASPAKFDRGARAKGDGVRMLCQGFSFEALQAVECETYASDAFARRWLMSTPRKGEVPFQSASILTIAAAIGLFAAGCVRDSKELRANRVLSPLTRTADTLGVELFRKMEGAR